MQHPAHVEDVAKALAWILDHIASYGGDPKRIFLMGHSAGAHLAALVTADEAYLKKFGKSPAMLSGVVLLDSAGYDIPRKLDDFSDSPVPLPIYKGAFGTDRQSWIDASPIRHVNGENLAALPRALHGQKSLGSDLERVRRGRPKSERPAAAVLARGKATRRLTATSDGQRTGRAD